MILHTSGKCLPKNKWARCVIGMRDDASSASVSTFSSKASGSLALDASGTMVSRIALRKNVRSGCRLAMAALRLFRFQHWIGVTSIP
jgi:hypothetical protein